MLLDKKKKKKKINYPQIPPEQELFNKCQLWALCNHNS